MVVSYVLFIDGSRRQRFQVIILILFGFLTKTNEVHFQSNVPYFFAATYFVYFGLISYRLFRDLRRQTEVGLETIAGVFCGFILIGVVASILFVSLDSLPGAFNGLNEQRTFSDFLYFSFITLLTIGYGDITPGIELTKKLVMLVGLTGHFYTIFVTAIILGKYLNRVSGT